MAASILKIVITRNTICDNLVSFPKSGHISIYRYITIFVTGYWKTDHNVTLGQLHFIGPANSHTHALSMH